MVWISRSVTAFFFLLFLSLTGYAVVCLESIGLSIVLAFLDAIFGYMVYYDVRQIISKKRGP